MQEELNSRNIGENTGDYNDPITGRFIQGNPGKPKGTRHLSGLLEEAIRRVATDTGTSEDITIVKKVIEKAKEGDMKAIEHIWDRLEGKPMQSLKIDNPAQIEAIKSLENIIKEIRNDRC